MNPTTPTGIPIERCDTCRLTHSVTREHCPVCGSPSFFCHQPREVDPICPSCGRNEMRAGEVICGECQESDEQEEAHDRSMAGEWHR